MKTKLEKLIIELDALKKDIFLEVELRMTDILGELASNKGTAVTEVKFKFPDERKVGSFDSVCLTNGKLMIGNYTNGVTADPSKVINSFHELEEFTELAKVILYPSDEDKSEEQPSDEKSLPAGEHNTE